MTIQPFPMVEMALKELIEAKYAPATGNVGGDLSYDSSDDLYVWIGLVDGSATEIDGQWIVDIDCFAADYVTAMTHALALEAVLLARLHTTPTMCLDNTFQNESPSERPWDDDSAYRIGATYVFTARRTG